MGPEETKMTREQKEAEMLKMRIARYEELKKLPQFEFQQFVKIKGWFYDGFYGKIYCEGEFVSNPEENMDKKVKSDEYVVISYDVIIQRWLREDDSFRTEQRTIETKYIEATDEEDPSYENSVPNNSDFDEDIESEEE